jgi:hypothetical protein
LQGTELGRADTAATLQRFMAQHRQ